MVDTRGLDRREHGEGSRMRDGGARDARWRHAHEVQGLLDTLAIYRRYAVDLAAENTMLRYGERLGSMPPRRTCRRRRASGAARGRRQPAGAARAAGHEPHRRRAAVLPLSERLERAFAGRVAELPEDTRLALLAAALDDGENVVEILRAASAVAGVRSSSTRWSPRAPPRSSTSASARSTSGTR